jgi:hypothetical protein
MTEKKRPAKRPTKRPKQPRREHDIRVPVLPGEHEAIKEKARQARLPVARYLREVGQAYVLKGTADLDAVREMARISGDMGRLGGLLKLWLKKDPRLKDFTVDTVDAMLARIEAQQDELGRVMQAVVRPRSD